MNKKYTYKEVYDSSLNYFNGDEMAATTWIKKYCLKLNDEYLEMNPDDMHRRLAKEFAKVEEKYEYKTDSDLNLKLSEYGYNRRQLTENDIYEMFKGFKQVIPGGSVMSGLGNPIPVSLSNCWVINGPEDSLDDIFRVCNEQSQLMKRRGGIGFDISKLRPNGAKVNNSAKSSTGAVSFMDLFSNVTNTIAQNGRRGATMLSISIKHPDSKEFIFKKQDLTKVTGANISVQIDNEFMNCVCSEDDLYIQTYPIDLKISKTEIINSNYEINELHEINEGCYIKVIHAKELWNDIIHCAWNTAEPGIIFQTNHHEYSPDGLYESFRGTCTNPCQPKWATVITKNGLTTIGEISIGDEIWSEKGWTKVINKWSNGVKDVYEYRTSGGVFYGTENHRLVSNGIKIEAKDCISVDSLSGEYIYNNIEHDPKLVMDGLVIGDGMVHKTSNNLIVLNIRKNDYDYFDSGIKDFIIKHRPEIKEYFYEVNTNVSHLYIKKKCEICIPDEYMHLEKCKTASLLRGLYSANGSVVGNRITYKTSSKKLRDQIQLLLSYIGIDSYFTKNKSKLKESYNINISHDKYKFVKLIGFIQKYKNEKINLKQGRYNVNRKLISSELISNEEVFDITVDNNTHTYWTGGLNVSNCGEIFMQEDSCRLIHNNLTCVVDNPFTENAKINDEKLYTLVYETTRLGDDLIDLESEAIKKIMNKIENDGDKNNNEYKLYERLLSHTLEGRRCGVGFTGMADMVAMLSMKYDSKESLEIIEHVMKVIFVAELDSEIDMAITRGHFPSFDANIESKGNRWYDFINENFESQYIKMMKYGRRNISFNTVAPTGTASIMALCSSGIEPIFLPVYKRRRKCMNDSDKVDFTDQNGEKYTEFIVVHPKLREWVEIVYNELSKNTLNDWNENDWNAAYKLSPWYNSTANDIDWGKRVELQGIIQKYITHSISSTINLPNSATEEEVSNIYMKSWKNNLKGITCYRDGCRSGVLVTTKKEAEKTIEESNKVCINNQPISKRPKEIPCKIFRFSNKGEKWIGVVGMVDNRPYEIFTGILEKLNIPNWVEDGVIIRNKEKRTVDGEEKLMSRYDICYIDKEGYRTCVEGLSRTFNSEYWNYAKLISGLLRHRMPLPYLIKIISSLNLDASNINTWKNGIIRTLRKLNEYNHDEGQYDVCPECGGRLLNEGGCVRCLDCVHSKCG